MTTGTSFRPLLALVWMHCLLLLASAGPVDAVRREYNIRAGDAVVTLREFDGAYPDRMPTRLTVTTAKGTTHRAQVDLPLGHPGRPLSDQQVEDKFRRLASRRLSETRVHRLIEAVWNLEQVEDIGTLMPLLKVTS